MICHTHKDTWARWVGALCHQRLNLLTHHCVLSFSFSHLSLLHATVSLSLWIPPSVLQCTTHVWPSKPPLSFSNSFFTFNLGSLFKLQWCRECQREYHDCHCPPGGVLESFQGHGCLLAGWQLVNYRHQTKLPGAQRYISARQQICTDMDCMSQLLTPPVGLSLSLSHTHTNLC